jgi:DNA-binding LytR/AlgR family response regulator
VSRLRLLVADDEPPARRRLLRLLTAMEDVDVVGEAGDGVEALDAIASLRPDAVLLDIRMPGLDGLRLARAVQDRTAIVFVTAYDQHAVAAFETNAVDYLLKPVAAERLRAALDRVRRRKPETSPLGPVLDELLRDRAAPVRLTARSGTTLRVFDPRRVARFSAADRYAVCLHRGEELILDESLGALETRLRDHGFLRVHRGELINLSRVRALRLEDGAWEAVLSDGQSVPVSRRMVQELKRRLGAGGPGA